jgi:hypothetical protein
LIIVLKYNGNSIEGATSGLIGDGEDIKKISARIVTGSHGAPPAPSVILLNLLETKA